MFIFGGYGGSGQVFNDMWLLHLPQGEEGFRWENLTGVYEPNYDLRYSACMQHAWWAAKMARPSYAHISSIGRHATYALLPAFSAETLLGTGPSPRFDHSTFIYPITPNSSSYDKMLIMGGRDLTTMFQDSHCLDLNSMTWEETQPPTLPYEICNNMCDGIESVPYHKVFSFGGKKGMMQYLNTVEVGAALEWIGAI